MLWVRNNLPVNLCYSAMGADPPTEERLLIIISLRLGLLATHENICHKLYAWQAAGRIRIRSVYITGVYTRITCARNDDR